MDEAILDCIQKHYTQFIEDHVAEAQACAQEDLKSKTRFVTFGHQNNHALRDAVYCNVNEDVRISSVS